jgi:putative membrane protein
MLHAGAPLAPHDLWSAWSLDPLFTLPLAASAALYARGVGRLWARAGRGRGVGTGAVAAFTLGWGALALALVSPLHPLGGVLFSAHMTQHELLMVVAAPLLVAGRPLVPTLWALPRRWRSALGGAARGRAVSAAWRWLRTPLHAWWLHLAALVLWHLPALYQTTLRQEAVHAAQHVSFFGSALLFWWALLHGRAPRRGAAVTYLFAAMLATSVLGALLTMSTRLWYPAYAATTAPWGLMPLEDQQLGGVIMWIPGGLSYLLAALWLLGGLLRDGAVRAARPLVGAPAPGR